MKIRGYTVLLIAALTLVLLTGCAPAAEAVRALETAEEAVEQRVDAMEDTVENAIRPTAPAPAAAILSAEEAREIALGHAGLAAGEADRLRTELEADERIPHYDIEFHHGHWEYEYEIHAETGDILSWEKDT